MFACDLQAKSAGVGGHDCQKLAAISMWYGAIGGIE
jgi:hypothetical protein